MARSSRSKSGTRKYGRNKMKCELYRKLRKHEKSHIRRIKKHIEFHKNDTQAIDALYRYQELL